MDIKWSACSDASPSMLNHAYTFTKSLQQKIPICIRLLEIAIPTDEKYFLQSFIHPLLLFLLFKGGI